MTALKVDYFITGTSIKISYEFCVLKLTNVIVIILFYFITISHNQCCALTALKDDHFITCTYGVVIQEWLTSLSFSTFIQLDYIF